MMKEPNLERVLDWARPEIRALEPYQPEAAGPTIRLDANESPFDVPQAFKAPILTAMSQEPWQRYPDPDCKVLKQAIAAFEGVDPGQVVVGNGSDELIRDLLTVFGGPGTTTVCPTPTFSMYRLLTLAAGGRVQDVPLENDWGLPMDALLAACRQQDARLTFIAAPNNPTGMAYPLEQLNALCRVSQGLVVIDEAYRLFSVQSYKPLLADHPQVVILHTFSKSFSLAGLRLGYLVAHPIVVDLLERVRLPYNVDRLVQVAATQVLAHEDHWRQQAELIKTERQVMSAQLAACPGITVYPSQANFILIEHAQAGALKAACAQADIAVRGFSGDARLQNCLRITIGRPEDNQQLLAVMRQVTAREHF